MLSDEEARIMEQWTRGATAWAESSQAFVAASTELATVSRRLAKDLVASGGRPDHTADRSDLAENLYVLAGVVEDGARVQSESYMGTAASLDQLRSLHG